MNTPDLIEDGGRPKLLSGRTLKLQIAAVSVLILTIGAWLTPRAAPAASQRTLSAPQEHAAPLLEEQVQQREAGRAFQGVQGAAAGLSAYGVAILGETSSAAMSVRNDFEERGRAPITVAGFGVFVSATQVLTHSGALDGRSTVTLVADDGRTGTGEVVAYEPASGLVLLRSTAGGTPPPAMAVTAPAPGTMAVAAARAERAIAAPVFITAAAADSYAIGVVGGSLLPGMPVYTLAGELLAVAGREGAELRAFPAAAAAQRLITRAAREERRSSFGLTFQELTGELTGAFGEHGVVVTEVVEGGPADLVQIQAGDVLLAVAGVEVDSMETATRELSSRDVGAPTRLRVQRNGRARDVDVTPALAYQVAAVARGNIAAIPGPDIRTVLPAALVTTAAIPPTARLVSVGGRATASRAQAVRELQRARGPIPILLRYNEAQYFVVIRPRG